jgi:formylglycine-generating enzyme required for sulfatase activity
MKRLCFAVLSASLLLFHAALAQGPDPNANISWPLPVYVVRGQVEIRGTANLADQTGYFIEFVALPDGVNTPDESAAWFPATLPVTVPVADDVLGLWDTTMIPDGVYALRLTVNTTGGSSHHVVSPLRVENNPPPFVVISQPEQTAVPPQAPVEPLPVGYPNVEWTPVERDINGMAFVFVPAGCFMMGSEVYADEYPVHEVCLGSFWISKTEVTNGQYAACVVAGVCTPPERLTSYGRDSYFENTDFANYPVIYVSWNQAQDFAAWVGGALPTEAQWEYAARGPESWTYPWGEEEPSTAVLNYDRATGDTSLVGAYPKGASWVGALDMAGNVMEWTNSLYRDYPYDADDGRELVDPSIDAERVIRGSAWYMSGNLHASFRQRETPASTFDSGGLRIIVYDINTAQFLVPAAE